MSELDFNDPAALALERERRRRRAEYSRELAAFTLEKWNLARNEAERKDRERRRRRAEGKPSKTRSSRQALPLPPGHHRQYGTTNPSSTTNPIIKPLLPLSNNATLARDQESPPTSPLQFQSRRDRERERERRKRVSGTREDIVAMLREVALQSECESESPGSDGSILSVKRAVIMKAGERALRGFGGHKSPRHLTPAKEVAIVLG